jgi:hypothetical protein
MSDTSDELVYSNGIDATTGEYLLPAMTPAEIAAAVRDEPADPNRLDALTKATNALTTDHLGLPFDVDPLDLAQAGWGLVFSADELPEVKAALAPLLARRTEQVSDAARLKVLEYKTGESRQRWLADTVAAGNIDPTRVRSISSSWAAPRNPVRLLPGTAGGICCRAVVVRHAGGVRDIRGERGRGREKRDQAAFAAGDLLCHPPRVRCGDAVERRPAGQAALGRCTVRARPLSVRVDLGRHRDARGNH